MTLVAKKTLRKWDYTIFPEFLLVTILYFKLKSGIIDRSITSTRSTVVVSKLHWLKSYLGNDTDKKKVAVMSVSSEWKRVHLFFLCFISASLTKVEATLPQTISGFVAIIVAPQEKISFTSACIVSARKVIGWLVPRAVHKNRSSSTSTPAPPAFTQSTLLPLETFNFFFGWMFQLLNSFFFPRLLQYSAAWKTRNIEGLAVVGM